MKELTERQKLYFQWLKEEEEQELLKNKNLIDSFIEYGKTKGIELTKEHFHYYQKVGIIAQIPGLVFNLDDGLKKDKEGLINYTQLSEKYKKRFPFTGYWLGEKFMISAHKNFRRNFDRENNFSPGFLHKYWKQNFEKCEVLIAIDSDMVRINLDDSMCMEYDTWYGPKFCKNIDEIINGNVKLRPPLDIECIDLLFNDVYSLDIKWYEYTDVKENKDFKVFQAEEFKEPNIKIKLNGQVYFPVKYVHAEYSQKEKLFTHLDGAIHFYTEDEYLSRRDSDMNFNEKIGTQIKTISEKLFKINGEISVEDWIELTSLFFTQNPLIHEYFQGEYPSYVKESIEAIRAKSK